MPLWLTESDVTSAMDLPDAIRALERVLDAEARGEARGMGKTHLMVGPNDVLQAFGGALAHEGLCGTKTWVNVAGKSQTVLIVYSLADGSLRAVIEATALGQIRTAAMSGVGTDWLARAEAATLAIVGTGKQALPQVAAVVAVRPVREVRVYSRKAENRARVAAEVRRTFPAVDVRTPDSLEEAVRGADVVTLCTNATAPFFDAALLERGMHVNAVGAIVPARVEFTADVFARCSAIAVDTLEGVRELSREFIDHFGAGRESWDRVQPLSQVVRSGRRRAPEADVTLFKAMGHGIADLAVATEVLRRAEERGLGLVIPERVRQELPLKARGS